MKRDGPNPLGDIESLFTRSDWVTRGNYGMFSLKTGWFLNQLPVWLIYPEDKRAKTLEMHITLRGGLFLQFDITARGEVPPSFSVMPPGKGNAQQAAQSPGFAGIYALCIPALPLTHGAILSRLLSSLNLSFLMRFFMWGIKEMGSKMLTTGLDTWWLKM